MKIIAKLTVDIKVIPGWKRNTDAVRLLKWYEMIVIDLIQHLPIERGKARYDNLVIRPIYTRYGSSTI